MVGLITGYEVPISQVERLSLTLPRSMWPNQEKPLLTQDQMQTSLPDKLMVVANIQSEACLKTLLKANITTLIDANALDESVQNFMKREPAAEKTQSLGVLLTCPVIYAYDIALVFVEALKQRLSFSQKRFDGIHLALHESIVNGLLHGNLQLSSKLRQSARDFIEYARLLDERLNDPAYARKSLSLRAVWNDRKLEIKIQDEGAGYDVASLKQQTAQPSVQAKSGRGLRLIAGIADSCTIEDFGREITLSFSLSDKDNDFKLQDPSEKETDESNQMKQVNLSKSRVLIIEDNKSNQAVLSRLLNIIGITQVELAEDGIDGLHKVVSFKPDLIILDITMPRMNGYEVLYHLKSAPETRSIPVLVQTASDTREIREKAFSSGATDFITKPVNPLEFFARVKVHLENRLLIHNLESQLSQLEVELQSARHMQVGMLPDSLHVSEVRNVNHLDIAQYFLPSSALGGDFWQMFPLPGNRLGIYLCDFSGHGLTAALNTFRLHGIIAQKNKRSITTPAAFLEELNKSLCGVLPRGQFATFFFGIYDQEKHILSYAGAGSPPPLLTEGDKIKSLDTVGLPLGIMKNATYINHETPFNQGDTLVMYSDALTESPNKEGLRLENKGFQELVAPYLKNRETDVQSLLRGIMSDFFAFAPPPSPDDVTVVMFRSSSES